VVERFKRKERKGGGETICFAIETGLFSLDFVVSKKRFGIVDVVSAQGLPVD